VINQTPDRNDDNPVAGFGVAQATGGHDLYYLDGAINVDRVGSGPNGALAGADGDDVYIIDLATIGDGKTAGALRVSINDNQGDNTLIIHANPGGSRQITGLSTNVERVTLTITDAGTTVAVVMIESRTDMQLVSADGFIEFTALSTTDDLPLLLPEKIIKFFDDTQVPANSGFYTYYQASGDHARHGNVLAGNAPEYAGRNTFVIDTATAAGTVYDGKAGIDTYVIRANLDKPVTIDDTDTNTAAERIAFAKDVEFREATLGARPDELLVTLSTGAVITIRNHDTFDYTINGMPYDDFSDFLALTMI
jgi:hypothetical protein